RWRVIGRANGIQLTSPFSGMVFDANGDLWLASRGSGIYQWVGYRDWEAWGEAQGLPSAMIFASRQLDADRVMVGTVKGPAWIDTRNGSAGRLSSTHPWRYGQVDALGLDGEGSAWAG